jgi:hypothetical protein
LLRPALRRLAGTSLAVLLVVAVAAAVHF